MRRMSPIARSGPTAATYADRRVRADGVEQVRARSSPTSATSAARSPSAHDVDSSSIEPLQRVEVDDRGAARRCGR